MSGRAERAGILVPTLSALSVFAALVALGTWQLQRKAWKEQAIGMLERRLAMPPIIMPGRDRWPELSASEHEFLRVMLAATFVPGEEALVYAAATPLRPDVSGVGYWVLAPARMPSGDLVVINRGFVPEGHRDPRGRPEDGRDRLELTGALRWRDKRGFFVPKDDPAHNLWFVRDPIAIAAAKGWGEVPAFYVELEAPQPPGGFPRPGRLKAGLRNEHLQYAVTWYGLAAAVIVMFVVWLRRRGPPQTGRGE